MDKNKYDNLYYNHNKKHIIEEIKEWKNLNLQIFNNNKLYNQIKNIN